MWPGILVQMITTKQPTPDMIEVAIVSMEQALEADGAEVPSGSDSFEQRPLDLVPPEVATAVPSSPAGVATPVVPVTPAPAGPPSTPATATRAPSDPPAGT